MNQHNVWCDDDMILLVLFYYTKSAQLSQLQQKTAPTPATSNSSNVPTLLLGQSWME